MDKKTKALSIKRKQVHKPLIPCHVLAKIVPPYTYSYIVDKKPPRTIVEMFIAAEKRRQQSLYIYERYIKEKERYGTDTYQEDAYKEDYEKDIYKSRSSYKVKNY